MLQKIEEEREEGHSLLCWLVSGFGIKGSSKKLTVNHPGHDFPPAYCFSLASTIEWEALM